MKVGGTGGVGSAGGTGKSRGASGEGFQIAQPATAPGPTQVSRASAAGGVMSVDAILALQEVAGPLERRRRAVGRADKILDVLEDVKIGLLSGELSMDDLERLRRAVRDERLGTDDKHLEDVLNEIETRAAVEIAKLERANRAA